MTDFYDVEKMLTTLGIGEAAVTVLSPRGIPTPLGGDAAGWRPIRRWSRCPRPTSPPQVAASTLQAKYGTTVDRDSAYERITARLAPAREAAAQAAAARADAADDQRRA